MQRHYDRQALTQLLLKRRSRPSTGQTGERQQDEDQAFHLFSRPVPDRAVTRYAILTTSQQANPQCSQTTDTARLDSLPSRQGARRYP